MPHLHEVRDTDTHFVIDPITRAITNPNSAKNKLMQGDHNSEIYTFEIPKEVEGHDMSLCNAIRIHYNDISADKANESRDVYIVTDMKVDETVTDTLVFSWLISDHATMYAGLLSFRIQFLCIDDSGNVTYKWHTDIFKGITISDGFDNAEAVIEDYSDALTRWMEETEAAMSEQITADLETAKQQLEAVVEDGLEEAKQTAEATLATNIDVLTAEQCTEGIYLQDDVVPCPLMYGYDADSKTTAFSGKHIARMRVQVFTAGAITVGTVDLNAIGTSVPVYTQSKQIEVAETGLVSIPVDMTVGANETLCVHSTSDTGKLAFAVVSAYDNSPLRIWKASDFESNSSDNQLAIRGEVYCSGNVASIDYVDNTVSKEIKQIRSSGEFKDVFVAEYGVTTYTEIKDAHNAGKLCVVVYGGYVYQLVYVQGNLVFLSATASYIYTIKVTTANAWSGSNARNLNGDSVVQTIGIASETSKVPSASAVYNFVNDNYQPTGNYFTDSDIIPIPNGGTGANERKEAMFNLAFLGVEPIDSVDNDTVANWNALGTGYAWYGSDGRLTDQPTSYALFVNLAYGSDLTQFWIAQPIGRVYKRSGSSAGWDETWFKAYDEKNKPTPAEIGAAASSHNQAASTITAGTFAGQVKANATAAATVGTAQVRNIHAGTGDLTAGSSALTTGDLYFVYE